MGEQFITCTITSETPIDWAIGDHCEFRGETYTLNYIPSVTQKAPIDSVQDAFTYDNVKLDSFQDELTRCMMLDVTPTTPEYQAVLGTNHTGSSRFQLYCGETTVNGSTLTAVCALALKMQANLDRLYPNAWHIYVDTTTTYVTASGETLLATHTDSKLLTFDNQTVAQALGLIHTEFKLDYSIKGRNIYIGYSIDSTDPLNPIEDLTGDNTDERFVFGYGRGYADVNNQGKSLFQIRQISNSQQKIVTRLRALGSTKNLPYNYYFKKYGLLSQALFPANLQLPGTFLPLGLPSDAANADGSTKWAQNNARSQYLRKVLGDTNDSYIDKNDNAASCPEGIREDCARWDGSNGELPEIYPTIEGVTFGELRNAGVPDQTGVTGAGAYQGASVQPDEERIDCLLAVGYTDNGVLIDDANIGDGIMPENEVVDTGTHFAIGLGQTKLTYNTQSEKGDFDYSDLFLEGAEQTLFTVKDVTPGNYFMVPTGPSHSCVAYRFSIGSFSSASAEVGFIIRVKQKVGNVYTPIATWYSDFVTASNTTGEKEMYLPELPDEEIDGQVSTLSVTELSDVVVTFAPLMQSVNASGQVTLTYQVGRSQSGEYDPEYTWCAVQGDVASKYPFHVFIKDMGFDLTATFNGETPVMAMKSGMCVGREFEIGENVQKATVNGIRGYLLTLNRVEDSNLHIYYPNEYYQLSAGDYFVLLNINMPDAYIRAAELRLLKAATEYLADNCETKYTYQPFIDDIYLQRNIDAMELAGTREKSIFWRLYAGLKLPFNGIPSSPGAQLPFVNMTIEQVSITMGEGLTPKVELTLNEDVEQTTLQKLTVAVDRIYNGSIFSSGGAGTNMEAVVDIASRLFLSKTHDDTANGRITFNDIATFLELIKAKGGINIGEFLPGFLGTGAHIGTDGRSEFEEVTVRGAMRAAELVFNRISVEEGEAIRSIGHGEILTVDEDNCVATLKLEGDEWPTIEAGDICRGLFNTIDKDYDNSDITETEDANGFRTKRGFFASYFRVEEILSTGKGECTFRYSLQPDTIEHPCPLMKFAVYGNFFDYNKERQSSMYITAVGIAPRMLFLAGVNDWQIKPWNIKVAMGNIDGVNVYEKLPDGTIAPKTLVGDAGLFVEDNIYFGGILNQFTAADWEYIQDKLGQGLNAELLRGSDNIIVDALGNIVGGIYEISTDGTTTVKRHKLHTGVLVYDSSKKRYLKAKPQSDETEIAEDEFLLSYTCDGCDVLRDGADFYITNINNTNDGLSQSTLTDEQLTLMRSTNECRINFFIMTANGWRTQLTYPVKLTHLDESYITFNLENEFDSISYRTQESQYNGLPVSTKINAYRAGEQIGIVSVTVKNALIGERTVTTGTTNVAFGNSGLRCLISADGSITIDHNREMQVKEIDLEDTKHQFEISCVAKYAGILYESGKRVFTLQEATNATLYKLLLSATSVSKDEGILTPSEIDVSVQIIDNSGSNTVSAAALNQLGGDVQVRYLDGAYNPGMTDATLIQLWSSSMPVLSSVESNCLTVMVVDLATPQHPVILDVQSVTFTSIGHDGAGQPWVKTRPNQVVIDCDSDGKVKETKTITIYSSLFWGDSQCVLEPTECVMGLESEQEDTPSFTSGNAEAYRTYTFTQGDVVKSELMSIFLTGTDQSENERHTASSTIPIIANLQGTKGEPGDAGAALVFMGNFDDGFYYVWNKDIRHCVKCEGFYWAVAVESNGTVLLGKPSNNNHNWEKVTSLKFTATELLLAENAAIDLLSSNVINLFNGSDKTASINADGNGSYCIYYKGSGNKRMEFSSNGYIYYYNDDESNTVAWKLGHGGDITNGSSDDWSLFPLHRLTVDDKSNLSNDSVFELTDYWQFKSGSGGNYSSYDGNIYTSIAPNRNPANGIIIPNGEYTPQHRPYQTLTEDGTKATIQVLTLYNGEVVQTQELTEL